VLRLPSLLSLLILLAVGCGPLRPGLPDPGCELPCAPDGGAAPRLSIASFNVRLFFDPVCDSGACAEGDWEQLPTPEQFGARAEILSAAIRGLDARIVLLQEIETQLALDALSARLPELPHSVLGEIGTPASVDVAVLSAHPVVEVKTHRQRTLQRPDGSYTRFTREFLEVHLEVEGLRVIVFAAHFRSKVNDDPGRRWAEAEAARVIALEAAVAQPSSLIVVGGDLNDVPGSPPLDALERDGHLLRASADRPDDQIGTFLFRGQSQAIDHLYLLPATGGQLVPESFVVIRDGPSGYGGSDHAAIRALFRLP
jgi:uncharacterized protein